MLGFIIEVFIGVSVFLVRNSLRIANVIYEQPQSSSTMSMMEKSSVSTSISTTGVAFKGFQQ